MGTKLGTLLSYPERLPPLSHLTLWSCNQSEITNILISTVKRLWLLNMAGCLLTGGGYTCKRLSHRRLLALLALKKFQAKYMHQRYFNVFINWFDDIYTQLIKARALNCFNESILWNLFSFCFKLALILLVRVFKCSKEVLLPSILEYNFVRPFSH